MLNNFQNPPFGFGPGSQPDPADGETLEYMALPGAMRTFAAHLPDVEDKAALQPALTLIGKLADACTNGGGTFDLSGFDVANRDLVEETLGKGEVSADVFDRTTGEVKTRIEESVFAGVWKVTGDGPDRIEVTAMPDIAIKSAFLAIEPAIGPLTPMMPGVVNAPAIISELMEKSHSWTPEADIHVINLSLLPHTPEDLNYMEMALGKGSTTVQSRGYGDCRIKATGLANVWQVQFFNSVGAMILDTYEVSEFPGVALAAIEDLEDSGERLREVLESIS